MTIPEIHALRAERTEIEDLLGDIECSVNALDLLIADSLGQSANPLLTESFAHETIGRSMRFRAEHGLL